ncbi:MAG: V-type ATPase 116kDa subunit family protein, partial [Chloroflexota bacterium]|nr:V-type ATPase 116kDa subunit family protein [Chloroflexota bacterium]
MLRSRTMSKVELVVPEADVIRVTETLADSGVFHPVPGEEITVGEDATRNEWVEWAAGFADLERRLLIIMESLGIVEDAPPTESPHLIDLGMARLDVHHIDEETQVYLRRLREARQHLKDLQQYVKQLEPIVGLDVDLDTLRDLQYIFVLPGTMPIDNIERLRTSLEHIPFELVILDRANYLASVLLFGARQDVAILERAARSAYLHPVHIPAEYRGTPAQALKAVRVGVGRTWRHIVEIQDRIGQLQEANVSHLRYLLWRVRASRKMVETIIGYEHLRYTYVVTGWTPAAEIQALKQAVRQVTEDVTFEIKDLAQEDVVKIPVVMDNPVALKGFQGLVTNYGYPSYEELDPTVLLALTFPLLFGIMFGDVGQGLLLALLGGVLISRKIRSLKGLAESGWILLACGLSASFFGFLYGSFFGSEDVLSALWIEPIKEINDILIATVGIGIGVLSMGMCANMLNAVLNRKWGEFLFGHHGLAGLLFYWSLLGIAVTAFSDLLPISPAWFGAGLGLFALLLIAAEPLGQLLAGQRPLIAGDAGSHFVQATFELFEVVIGLFSNTLSYVRMGAFAVAHGALSLVVF